MATHRLENLLAKYPNETVLAAYPASNWVKHPTDEPPTGEPIGSPTAEATVEAGIATLTGLLPNTTYYVTAKEGVEGSYRYITIQGPDTETITISATEDGDNTLVAAQSGRRIQVLGYVLNADGEGDVKLQDSAESAEVFRTFALAANGGVVRPETGVPHLFLFETSTGLGLEVNVPEGVDVGGELTYRLT